MKVSDDAILEELYLDIQSLKMEMCALKMTIKQKAAKQPYMSVKQFAKELGICTDSVKNHFAFAIEKKGSLLFVDTRLL